MLPFEDQCSVSILWANGFLNCPPDMVRFFYFSFSFRFHVPIISTPAHLACDPTLSSCRDRLLCTQAAINRFLSNFEPGWRVHPTNLMSLADAGLLKCMCVEVFKTRARMLTRGSVLRLGILKMFTGSFVGKRPWRDISLVAWCNQWLKVFVFARSCTRILICWLNELADSSSSEPSFRLELECPTFAVCRCSIIFGPLGRTRLASELTSWENVGLVCR